VLVVVLAVSGVPAPVVHIVDVIPVRDRDMATSFTVHMVMRLMHRVTGWLAFVVVILVLSMNVTVVHVVDMIPVWDRDVTASFAVHMIVFEVLAVDCARHRFSPPRTGFDSLAHWRDESLVPPLYQRENRGRQPGYGSCNVAFGGCGQWLVVISIASTGAASPEMMPAELLWQRCGFPLLHRRYGSRQ